MERNIESVNIAILNIIKNVFPRLDSKRITYSKIVIPKEQAWGTYKIRYNIKVDKGSLDNTSKQLYEHALERLKSFNEEMVSVHWFTYDSSKAVIVFTDITDDNIIGHILLDNVSK